MLIEQAGGHQTQRVHSCFLRERPRRAEQPWVSVIDAGVLRKGVARMQVEGHIQRCDLSPEWAVLRKVVVERDLARALRGILGESIDQGPDKSEVVHTAAHFRGCGIGILQRKGGEGAEAIWALGALRRERIVGATCDLHGAHGIGDRLHRWRVEREDHHLDPVLVHQLQTPILYVEQSFLKLLPVRSGYEAGRVLQSLRYRPMLLERNLANHELSSRG